MSRAPKATLADLAELQRQGLVKVTGRSKNKYGAKRCVVRGEAFDSKAEARRWLELTDMERRGQISGLRRQVEYPLVVGGIKICAYRCDFEYHTADGVKIVEDVKSPETAKLSTFRIKARLMRAVHGITVSEHMA